MTDDGGRLVEDPSSWHGSAWELQELLVAGVEFEQFLHELAVLAVRTIDAEITCGVTLRRHGQPYTAACADERAGWVDEVQYSRGQGPCLHSLSTGEIVSVEDLAADDRWADYRSRALLHGVRSSLSLPLRTAEAVVGALNLYAFTPAAFGPDEREAAERFAAEASRALVLADRQARQVRLVGQLQAAMASRRVIDHAIGIIMAQNRCTADEAFAILRTASQGRNIKLRLVAGDIVTAVTGRPPTEDPAFRP